MIGMVESLLNEENLHATSSSSHETEEAAKQDNFLFQQPKDGKQSAAKLVQEFLDVSSQRHANASLKRVVF